MGGGMGLQDEGYITMKIDKSAMRIPCQQQHHEAHNLINSLLNTKTEVFKTLEH